MLLIAKLTLTSDKWMDEYGALVEWYLQGKAEVLKKTPTLVPLCLPQVQHALIRDWTKTFVLRGQWLTAWTMVWPHGNIDYVARMVGRREMHTGFGGKPSMKETTWKTQTKKRIIKKC